MPLTISAIPILDSNYCWVIQPDAGRPDIYLVDPGDAAPVIHYLNAQHLYLQGILVTHRHRDHIAGIYALLQLWPCPVYGPDSDHIPQITHKLKGGDRLKLAQLTLEVIAVPGHTKEHIAYFIPPADASDSSINTPNNSQPSQLLPNSAPLLFCGDTLFAGGCGRLFDGPAAAMFSSLQQLASLPDTTQIYCTHEYTLANLEFALAVEPENPYLIERLKAVRTLRSHNKITLPSTILLEKRTNPFLRCQQTGIKNFIKLQLGQWPESAMAAFSTLRQIKDSW